MASTLFLIPGQAVAVADAGKTAAPKREISLSHDRPATGLESEALPTGPITTSSTAGYTGGRKSLTAWGDQGDGTYVNPIVPADFSDLDAVRVGDDFYAISSTLHMSPGMAVLHSRDLVNWSIISHAISDVAQVDPELDWNRMGHYGRGVWAGAISYHNGRYWVYFTSPDTGLFMTSAASPAGPWDPVHHVWKVKGYNDPCPFWDDDGRGYLVMTNFEKDPANGRSYNIHLYELSDDGKTLDLASDRIIHQSPGAEASKLFKVEGRYYHFYSEVKDEGRVVMMNRAKSLDGPWETRQLNHVNPALDREPNQGSILQVSENSWWFLTHQGTGDWEGRTMALLPVQWIDGWPIMGAVGPDGIGNMMWAAPKPINGAAVPPRGFHDDFESPELRPDWEWNHQPRADKWSLTERPGFVRLHASPALRSGEFKSVANVLTVRSVRTASNQLTVKLDLAGLVDGQEAGLAHFARTSARLAVLQHGGKKSVTFVGEDGESTAGPTITADTVWIRSTWDIDGRSRFSYSTDGQSFTEFGDRYQLTWGFYRGDRVGIYTLSRAGEDGYLDIDSSDYQWSSQSP